jgi:acetolactate synthase-1/2/3 large subunit
VVEKPPFFMTVGGRTVIHVNYSPANVDDVYFPHLELVGDIASTFRRLTEMLGPVEGHELEGFEALHREAVAMMTNGADDPRFPPVPQRIVADVRRALPDDGIVTLDNGMYKIWFARHYRARLPNSILLDNALATMGAGLPSAIAAAILHPKRRVMAVTGDGGFMMNSQEMETAVRLGLNLVVVVLRDDSYGMIRWKQGLDDMPDWGLTFGNPDFVAYANSYGATGHRVEATEALAPTLDGCFEKGGVHLVEVPIDYSENDRLPASNEPEISAR